MKLVSPYSDEELLRLALEELEELRLTELTEIPRVVAVAGFGSASLRRPRSTASRQRELVKHIATLRRRMGLRSLPEPQRSAKRQSNIERSRAAKQHKWQMAEALGSLACEACRWRPPAGIDPRRVLHCHHVVPVSCGGANDAPNLIVICPNCHAVAHALTPRVKPWAGPRSRVELLAILKSVPA